MFRKIVLTAIMASTMAIGVQHTADAAGNSVRDHRTKTVVRDHRTVRKNEVVRIRRKDCRVGYQNLYRAGYRDIAIIDCSGRKYSYLAKKDSGLFRASMHAYSGTMKIGYIGFAH